MLCLHDGGGNHVRGNVLLPEVMPRLQIPCEQSVITGSYLGRRRRLLRRMFRVVLSGRVGDEKVAVRDRWLAHQRIAQPLLPDDLAGLFVHDDHRTTLGVERHITTLDHGGSRPVLRGIYLPGDLARLSLERVELMGSLPTTHK